MDIIVTHISDSFATYYGLDWLSMITGFIGAYLLGNKDKRSFIFSIISLLAAITTAVWASLYGFVFANLIGIGFALRNYYLWHREEVDQKQAISQQASSHVQ